MLHTYVGLFTQRSQSKASILLVLQMGKHMEMLNQCAQDYSE